MEVEETIVAIASTHEGGGLRGIVRVSGPQTLNTVERVLESEPGSEALSEVTASRRIERKLSLDTPFGSVPVALFVWPDERSYTRQPTIEVHTFGSTPILNAIVETLCQHGARVARPGEFTLRAFLAGRIDLAQAEAVLGVIDAIDQRELNVALEQLAGGLSQPLDQLRNTLLNLCADLEAGLDFVEDDIEFITQAQIERELRSALDIIETAERQMRNREQATQLPRVVLRGEANVGKSSLWNAMCDDEAEAIVTDEAGTTRDYLTGIVKRFGQHFLLIDTAGIEHGDESLDRLLRATSDRQADTASLILLCIDGSREMTEWERQELRRLKTEEASEGRSQLVVFTKADLLDEAAPQLAVQPDLLTSCHDPDSVQQLAQSCVETLNKLASETSVVASTAARCRESLRLARESVESAIALTTAAAGDELVAVEVRTILEHLGQIVGVIYTDDILDRVFSRFCIGK